MTPQQAEIIQAAQENGGTITKKEAVSQFGRQYYCNADKHIGDRLARMVNAGMLERVKPGTFKVSKRIKSVSTYNSAQADLF